MYHFPAIALIQQILYIYPMEPVTDIQKTLFNQIRERLPSHTSFVHEIAELLGISYDSAYRRIRGEKELDMQELYLLSCKFGISIDHLFGVQSNSLSFNYFALEHGKLTFLQWLEKILADMKWISEAREKQIIYIAKDPPLFHNFQLPEIAAFKVFFWQKTLCRFPEFEDQLFRIDNLDTEIWETGRQMLSIANKIPTIEIWNEDTFKITMKQLEYYHISGYFAKKDDILNLCDKLQKWLLHIQKQAEYGFKFMYGDDPDGIENSYKLYENEVVHNDNTILVKREDRTIVYLTFNTLSLLVTQSPFFCEKLETYSRQLMRKSHQISISGTKERNRLFNKFIDHVKAFRERIA